MEHRTKRKTFLLFLTACIACSIVFTVVLTAAEHNHDCIGENCTICLQIKAANNFLKTLKFIRIGLFLFAFFAYLFTTIQKYTCCNIYLSQVALKIRINS